MNYSKIIIVFCACLIAGATAIARPGLVEYRQALSTEFGDPTRLMIALNYKGEETISAIQFLVDLDSLGLKITDASACLKNVPATHKGEGALSSCKVLSGNRLGVVISDVASFAALTNGLIGSVQVERMNNAKTSKGNVEVSEVALFSDTKKRIDPATLNRPVKLFLN